MKSKDIIHITLSTCKIKRYPPGISLAMLKELQYPEDKEQRDVQTLFFKDIDFEGGQVNKFETNTIHSKTTQANEILILEPIGSV